MWQTHKGKHFVLPDCLTARGLWERDRPKTRLVHVYVSVCSSTYCRVSTTTQNEKH